MECDRTRFETNRTDNQNNPNARDAKFRNKHQQAEIGTNSRLVKILGATIRLLGYRAAPMGFRQLCINIASLLLNSTDITYVLALWKNGLRHPIASRETVCFKEDSAIPNVCAAYLFWSICKNAPEG